MATGVAAPRDVRRLNRNSSVSTPVWHFSRSHLKGMTRLDFLSLAGTQVTDAGLAHLKALSGLRQLVLFRTQVTPAGVADLNDALPNVYVALVSK